MFALEKTRSVNIDGSLVKVSDFKWEVIDKGYEYSDLYIKRLRLLEQDNEHYYRIIEIK